MATIPEVPPEQKIVPIDGGRRQQIPTYDNGSVTPENTFTTPFIAGEKTAQLVGNIADQFNKAADKTALEDGAKMGYLEQQRNIEEGNREYVGGGTAFSISAQAYQKGANVAYMMRKKADYEIGLKELAEKRSNDTNRFNLESNELKKKILSDVPQSLMGDISLDFDKNKLNFETQIVAIQRKQQYDQNIDDIKNGMYREISKINGMISTSGMQSEGLTESFVNMQSSLESLREHFNLSPKEMREVSDELRKKLFGVYLKHEFEKVKTDPTSRQTIKAQLRNGTYNFSEMGDEYGQFIPGGKNISLRESDAYSKIFEQYEKEYVTGLAGQLHAFELAEKNKDQDAVKGRNYIKDVNGNYQASSSAFDDASARVLGMDEKKISELKFERESSIYAGNRVNAYLRSDLTDYGRIMGQLNQEEIEANQLKDIVQKSIRISGIAKARKEIDSTHKERLDHEAKGTYADYWTERMGPLHFSNGINLSDAAGTREWKTKFEQLGSNKPFFYSGLPAEQGKIELLNLTKAKSVDELIGAVGTLNNRQQEFSSMWLSSGIKALKGTEKDGLHSYVMLQNLVQSNQNTEAQQLAAAILQKKDNFDALKSKGTILKDSDTFTIEMKNVRQKFFDDFGKQIDFSTAYGKSLYDSYEAIYLKVRQGRSSESDAEETALKFVRDTNTELQLKNGNKVLLPKSELYNAGYSSATELSTVLNDAMSYPHEFNIIPALGQTFDDLKKDMDNYNFTYHSSGQFILKNKKNDIAATVFMKQPSGANQLLFSDAVVGVTRDKAPTVFQDTESTWQMKTNFNKLLGPIKSEKEIRDSLKPGFKSVLNESATDRTERKEQDLSGYVKKLQITYVENFTKYDEKLKRNVYTYEDWIVPAVFGMAENRKQVANAISLKAKENKLDNRDLLWLAENAGTFQAFSDPIIREDFLKQWSKDHSQWSKMTTKNYGATIMSPLQVMATIVNKQQTPEQQAPAGP